MSFEFKLEYYSFRYNFATTRSKVRRTISFTLWTGRYILICRVVFCFYALTSSYNLASSLSKRSGKYIVVQAISNILIITTQNFLHVCLIFNTYYRDSTHPWDDSHLCKKYTKSIIDWIIYLEFQEKAMKYC